MELVIRTDENDLSIDLKSSNAKHRLKPHKFPAKLRNYMWFYVLCVVSEKVNLSQGSRSVKHTQIQYQSLWDE